MVIPKLAMRNLLGAGVRTWLNVLVLSFSFVVIIWTQGLIIGLNEQASVALVNSEYGGGQYWQANYDPYDPLTWEDSHAALPDSLQSLVQNEQAVPILVVQGNIFPNGRLLSVVLKGIIPGQKVLDIPSEYLDNTEAELPIIIGSRMAQSAKLNVGDYVTIRWRDIHGTFDAREAKIVHIFKTTVPTVDNGQVWLPLKKLAELIDAPGQATLVVTDKTLKNFPNTEGWSFKSPDYLLSDILAIVKTKTASSSILYALLLFLALLAIFDTQVLSIFRRHREIGTLIALGMTRKRVIQLFTFEGALHGVFAILVAAVYGIPLLVLTAKFGIKIPDYSDDFGIAISNKLIPFYSAGLILGTIFIVFFAITIVSFLPTRRISKLSATDALRGKRI